MQLPFLCEKSRAIAIALPGLMAGSHSVSQSVSQSGRRNSAKFNFLKLYTGWNSWAFAMFNKGTVLL